MQRHNVVWNIKGYNVKSPSRYNKITRLKCDAHTGYYIKNMQSTNHRIKGEIHEIFGHKV